MERLAKELIMPQMGETMTQGKIVNWRKKVGDRVEMGEVLLDVETDKTTIEVESTTSGTLLSRYYEPGDTVPILQIIGYIGERGERVPTKEEILASSRKPSAPKGVAAEKEAAPTPQPAGRKARERIFISPLARRMAREHNIDISLLTGSGPNGRIIQRDIERYLSERAARPTPAPALPEDRVETMSQMRRIIAERLQKSKRDLPHFYVGMEIDMSEVVRMRESLTAEDKVSYNDIIIKAVARTLREFPGVNATCDGERITYRGHVNIGVAVAIEDGLIVPVIRDADLKGISQIAAEVKELATKARERKLSPDDYSGGTFTVSNLGMFGVDFFTAIINPPESAILAVGAISERPVARDGQVVVRPTMNVVLSCDHRVVDGALAARFLNRLKQILENPYLLIF
ncbi:MAG: dihydrolipoamide acetyltransferase family protein [bacterium]